VVRFLDLFDILQACGGKRFALYFGLDLRRTAILKPFFTGMLLVEENVQLMSSISSISAISSPIRLWNKSIIPIGFPAAL